MWGYSTCCDNTVIVCYSSWCLCENSLIRVVNEHVDIRLSRMPDTHVCLCLSVCVSVSVCLSVFVFVTVSVSVYVCVFVSVSLCVSVCFCVCVPRIRICLCCRYDTLHLFLCCRRSEFLGCMSFAVKHAVKKVSSNFWVFSSSDSLNFCRHFLYPILSKSDEVCTK